MVEGRDIRGFAYTPSNFVSVQEPLPRLVATKLSTTDATTIYTATSGKNALEAVVQLRIANTSSSAQTVTVNFYDSSVTTNFAIYSGKSIAANDTLIDENLKFKMESGDSINCAASTANTLEVILMVTERGRSF